MRKLYIVGLIAVALLVIGIAIADEIKFSTYYPAPFGQYREFSTTGKTCLATDEYGIETNARVGIGTTDPQAILHISDGEIPGNFIDDDLDGVTDETGQEMVFTKTGNVGIGQMSPSAPLDVKGSGLLGGQLRLSADIDITKTAVFGVQFDNDLVIQTCRPGVGTGGDIILQAGIPSDSSYAGGNVGIGTTQPQAKLHLGGTPGPTNGIKFPDGTVQTTAGETTVLLDTAYRVLSGGISEGWADVDCSGCVPAGVTKIITNWYNAQGFVPSSSKTYRWHARRNGSSGDFIVMATPHIASQYSGHAVGGIIIEVDANRIFEYKMTFTGNLPGGEGPIYIDVAGYFQ